MITSADLPVVNASLNALSAVFLCAGFAFIRRKNIPAHRACMLAALATTAVFLACYLTYHYHVGHVPFGGQGWVRSVYLIILITHTFLAAAIVPLVIITVTRALREQFDQHKRIARITLPLWLYVCVTGVIVYLMVYQFYPAR